MALTTFSRPGRVNNAGDANTLFLKKFAGEVLTTFETNAVFKPLHLVRTIENGKSASFPVTGTADTRYMAPGDNLLTDTVGANSYLSGIAHGEQEITINNLLTSSTFIARIEEAKNHFDVRSIYTEEIGRALAKKFDQTIAQLVVNASRTAASAPKKAGSGSVNIGTGAGITGTTIASGIFSSAVKLDQTDVPDDGERYCVLPPDHYALLVQVVGGPDKPNAVGSYSKNNILEVAGVKVLKSNNLPSMGASAVAETNSLVNYNDNTTYANVGGVVFHKNAVGTVKLLDLAVESEYKIELQGTLIVSKYAMGHGVLRPECAVVLNKA